MEIPYKFNCGYKRYKRNSVKSHQSKTAKHLKKWQKGEVSSRSRRWNYLESPDVKGYCPPRSATFLENAGWCLEWLMYIVVSPPRSATFQENAGNCCRKLIYLVVGWLAFIGLLTHLFVYKMYNCL